MYEPCDFDPCRVIVVRGQRGVQGAIGPTGATGDTGATGATGADGTQQPNPFAVYVRAGQVGGDGTPYRPFGTLQEGVEAVAPHGTVYLQAGEYSLASELVLSKTGVKICADPLARCVIQADIIGIRIAADGVCLCGCVITSDQPYPRECVQIGGNSVCIRNCRIYGPPQAGGSDTWVANRAIVTQGNVQDVQIVGNILYSLRQAGYFNPGGTGWVCDNVVYNTRGFVVDGAILQFSGNSWANPANAVDLALLNGTPSAPYDPLTVLQQSNSNANVSDQR